MDTTTHSDIEACEGEEELELVARNRDVHERCPVRAPNLNPTQNHY